MLFDEPPLEGRFLRRYKRFFADVQLDDGTVLTAHCPNTGSLLGLLEEGRPAWLRDSRDPKRKLRYTWQAVRDGDTWVNVDTSLPNRVVHEALEARAIPELHGFDSARREVRYGTNSRIDVLLEGPGDRRCYVEVKSTTLARDGVGLFPDAVTSRGLKHLHELIEVVRQGHRAAQLFLLSRGDVHLFRPADDIDPAYGRALREAAAAGVEVLAYRALVGPREMRLGERVEVDLSGEPPPPLERRRKA